MYREKRRAGDYTEIKILCLKINRQMQTKNTRSSVRTGRVRPKDGYIYRFVRERFEQAKEEGLVTFKRTKTGPLVDQNGDQAHWNIYIKKYLGDAMGAPSTLIPERGSQHIQCRYAVRTGIV